MASATPPSALTSGKGMLVVIDPAVEDYTLLTASALPKSKVVILEKSQDAIAQITAAIKQDPSVSFDSLHLVALNSPGVLHFSSGDFSLQTLKPYVESIQSWFHTDGSAAISRTLEPQILLYGRRVGAGQSGTEFVDTLSWLTGATVIAAKDGDRWPSTDGDRAQLAFSSSAQQIYQGTFSI